MDPSSANNTSFKTFSSELTHTLVNLAKKPPKIHIDPSTMLALIPVILAQLSSDLSVMLRIAHDRPCLRWTLALTCTRPLSVWRDKVHLDDLIEAPNPHIFTRTSVLFQRLASTNSLCNKHLVKILGDVERSKSYGTVGCGLLPLIGVIGIYAAMMAISYHFAARYSVLAAKLSLAVFFSQMLTGLFSTYDRSLDDEAGQRQRHADRLFARIRHASLQKPSSSPPTPKKSQTSTSTEANPVASNPRPRTKTLTSTIFGGTVYWVTPDPPTEDKVSTPLPSALVVFPALFHVLLAGLYWLHTRLILTFPSLVAAEDLELPHSEDLETDITIEAKIAGWTASFEVPITRIEEKELVSTKYVKGVEESESVPAPFSKYRYTFSNMKRAKPVSRWAFGALIRWLRLEWILILGQLTAWGAIVTGPLQAALCIGLTQVIGTLLIFAGVYFITLGDSYKDDRIIAAFRLADPKISKGVFLLPHDLARTIWNDVRHIFRAERVYNSVLNDKFSTRAKTAARDYHFGEVEKAILRCSDLAKKYEEEINSNSDTRATYEYYKDWLVMAKSEKDHRRIHEEVPPWEETVAYDNWVKTGEQEEVLPKFSDDGYETTEEKITMKHVGVQSQIPNPYWKDEVEPKGGRVSRAGSRRSATPIKRTESQELDEVRSQVLGQSGSGSITTRAPPPSASRPSSTRTSATRTSTNFQQQPLSNSTSTFIDDPKYQRLSVDSMTSRLPRSTPTSEGEQLYGSESSAASSPSSFAPQSQSPSNRPRSQLRVQVTEPTPPHTRNNTNDTRNNTNDLFGAPQGQPTFSRKGRHPGSLTDAREEARKFDELKKAQEMEEGMVKELITSLFDEVDPSPPSANHSTTLQPPPSNSTRFSHPSTHGHSRSLSPIAETPSRIAPPPATTSLLPSNSSQYATLNTSPSLSSHSGESTPRLGPTRSLAPAIDLASTHPESPTSRPLPASATSPPSSTYQEQQNRVSPTSPANFEGRMEWATI